MSSAPYEKTVIFHEAGSTAIVYIHGGAWIDDRNTPADFLELSKMIQTKLPDITQAAIEYRLSPEVRHPVHLNDCIENLTRLIHDKKISKVHLVGHSVGATLCWQIITSGDTFLKSIVEKVFLVDGIYSVKELLQEYPDYCCFVDSAFNSVNDFSDPVDSVVGIDSGNPPQLHIIHSYNDELLTLRQTDYMVTVLKNKKIPFKLYIDDLGLHEQVYSNVKLSEYLISVHLQN